MTDVYYNIRYVLSIQNFCGRLFVDEINPT